MCPLTAHRVSVTQFRRWLCMMLCAHRLEYMYFVDDRRCLTGSASGEHICQRINFISSMNIELPFEDTRSCLLSAMCHAALTIKIQEIVEITKRSHSAQFVAFPTWSLSCHFRSVAHRDHHSTATLSRRQSPIRHPRILRQSRRRSHVTC